MALLPNCYRTCPEFASAALIASASGGKGYAGRGVSCAYLFAF